jgi:hypothetical protein
LKAWQRTGGIAALVESATFIIGFALYLSLLASDDYGSLTIDPRQNVEFLVDNEAVLYLWHLIIYVLFGLVLVFLTLALYDLLKAGAPILASTGAAFGVIWAVLVIASGMVANVGASVVIEIAESDPEGAATTWRSLHFVVDGLGGGNEIVGGVWVGLVSWAAFATGKLPRLLNYLGLVIGAAGIVSTVPPLAEALGAVFGLGLIVWFAWLGVVLLRRSEATTP